MMPGYNTDFSYRGLTFHAQTEDNGTANPFLVSLLYHKGAIIASRKTSYRELLGADGLVEQLREMMRAQHKALMRELLSGVYDEKMPCSAVKPGSATEPSAVPAAPGGPAGGPGERAVCSDASPSLDEAITRYLEAPAAADTTAR